MNGSKVSIIVAVYNGENTLASTIESLLSQTYSNIELVLVDDGSSDSSSDIIKAYLHDSRVGYFKKENGGVASARNFGIKNSTGDFIAFCDQDDQWFSDKLERQLPLFQDSSVGLVYSWAEVKTEDSTSYINSEIQGECFYDLLLKNFIVCCTVVVRTELLERLGGFDDSRDLQGVDDRHLWLRVALNAKFAVVKSPLATYVLHASNYSSNQMKMLNADLLCINKIAALPECVHIETAKFKLSKLNIYLHYADNFLYQNMPVQAGKCCLSAWKIRPLKIQFLIKFILFSFMPVSLFIKAKAIYKKVKGVL